MDNRKISWLMGWMGGGISATFTSTTEVVFYGWKGWAFSIGIGIITLFVSMATKKEE